MTEKTAHVLTSGRESDVLVHKRVFGHLVVMMGVSRDPECGEWLICPDCENGTDEEAEALLHSLGINPHAHHESEQPCYRESPDGPVSVVPEYTTDPAAARRLLDHWRGDWQIRREGRRESHLFTVVLDDTERGVGYLGAGDSEAVAICRATYESTFTKAAELPKPGTWEFELENP